MKKLLLTLVAVLAWVGVTAQTYTVPTVNVKTWVWDAPSKTLSGSVTATDGTVFDCAMQQLANTPPSNGYPEIRWYANNSLIVTAPAGYAFEKIVFTADKAANAKTFKPDNGSMVLSNSDMTWTADQSKPVSVFRAINNNNGQIRITSMVITLKTIASADAAEAGLSFPAEDYTATMPGTFTAPELTKATTADVTYESSNPEVATVDAATGQVTLVGGGETIITAKAPATADFKAGEAMYMLTVTDNRPAADLSFDASEYTADVANGTFAMPVNNPNGLAVTYASSNTSVATVDAEGNVTLVGVGTADITATTAATPDFHAGNATYTLTVTDNNLIYSGLVTNCTGWNLKSSAWSWYTYTGTGNFTDALKATSSSTINTPVSAVSPEIDLSGYWTATLKFEHACNSLLITDIANKATMDISVDGGEFTPLMIAEYPTETYFTYVENVQTLEPYVGHKIKIRFNYANKGYQGAAWQIRNFAVRGLPIQAGISDIEAEDNSTEAVFFNLQGQKVANPAAGLYIKVQGNKATKVIVK